MGQEFALGDVKVDTFPTSPMFNGEEFGLELLVEVGSLAIRQQSSIRSRSWSSVGMSLM
jgi:hypothetical protein